MNNSPYISSATDRLFLAIKENNVNVVGQILSQDQVDPNSRLPQSERYESHNGCLSCNVTALHQACIYGYPEIVTLLIHYGANLEARTMHDDTPLIEAAFRNHSETIDILLRAGAKANAVECGRESALVHAARHGNIYIMSQLINHGAIINFTADNGRTPLCCAVRSGSYEAVTLLLNNGACVHSERERGSLLMSAIYSKNNEILVRLIKAGLNPEGIPSDSQPLAAIAGTISSTNGIRYFTEDEVYRITDILLNSGSDPNLKNNAKSSPLSSAVFSGRPEIISLLVEHGAKLTGRINGKPLLAQHSVIRRDEVEAMVNSLDPVTSLQSACRLVIRKALVTGKKPEESLISNTPLLPLPSGLKTYICNLE
ncbi:ankyrin repeat domain-containing protein [Endozoicomonas sp. ONNA2]|uniref:ankyrin repeat domain-containing protein n=1 Tax=Endozoicomonas sp. ONNA2 TaxID=2828741 RepID=UPI002147E718|nr:ankyrin repeat domain-containing protein [Endozoicomonas sp. ONNA2]